MKDRNEALALLQEYTKSESLLNHAFAVEAAMRWYARKNELPAEEVEKWAITGLLHDFDYEAYPHPEPPDGHPFKGNAILTELGWPEDIREAIMGHAQHTGVPRQTLMAKTLFAVDELAGLITAAVYVRPDRSIHTLTPKSVKKRLKDKAFARGCNREDIKLGAEELGVDLTEHIQNVISAMAQVADELGLAGEPDRR